MGGRAVGPESDAGPQHQDAAEDGGGVPSRSAVPEIAAVSGRRVCAGDTGAGVCHYPLAEVLRCDMEDAPADSPSGGGEVVAEAVREHAGIVCHRSGAAVSALRSDAMAGAYAGNSGVALLASDRRALSTRGAKSGAATSGKKWHGDVIDAAPPSRKCGKCSTMPLDTTPCSVQK